MFVSTFELLLNVTQLPRSIENKHPDALKALRPFSREILQGYFLTLSLENQRPVSLQILFTVITSAAEEMVDKGTVTSTSRCCYVYNLVFWALGALRAPSLVPVA